MNESLLLIYPLLSNGMNISVMKPLTLHLKSWQACNFKSVLFNYSNIIPVTIFFHHRAFSQVVKEGFFTPFSSKSTHLSCVWREYIYVEIWGSCMDLKKMNREKRNIITCFSLSKRINAVLSIYTFRNLPVENHFNCHLI